MGIFLGDEMVKVVWIYIMVMVAEFCEYPKNHWITHFTFVNFVVCGLFLNKAIKYTHTHTQNLKLDLLNWGKKSKEKTETKTEFKNSQGRIIWKYSKGTWRKE